MPTTLHPVGTATHCQYAVVLTFKDGSILLGRHSQRQTWEFQAGHIESGESPEAAAHRELYEESGVVAHSLTPVCDY